MRRRFRGSPVLLAGAVVLLTAGIGCRRAAGPPPSDPLVDVFERLEKEEGLTREQTHGKRLFAHYCATCHGETGQGDGQNAYNLQPKPTAFESAPPEARRPSYWRRIIEGGTASVGRSPLCPPWGRTLDSSEIDALVAYLHVLAQPSSPAVGEPPG